MALVNGSIDSVQPLGCGLTGRALNTRTQFDQQRAQSFWKSFDGSPLEYPHFAGGQSLGDVIVESAKFPESHADKHQIADDFCAVGSF
jgi:hypothetical protein